MKKPTQRQIDFWYEEAKRLDEKSTDGYSMGTFDDRGYTFRGGVDPDLNSHNRPHRSLEAIGGALYQHQQTLGATEDTDGIGIADAPTAEFWRIVGNKANNLPRNYKHRALLVEVAERGALNGVVKKFGLSKRKGEWVWRKFLVDVCELPPPKTTVPGRSRCRDEDPAPPPAPVRKLSKAEIKRLQGKYTPPKKAAQ